MCRWVVFSVLLLCGCRSDSADRPVGADSGAVTKPSSPTGRVAAGANLAALRLSHSAVTARLGAHRLTCKSTLQTKVAGFAPRKVVQQMVLNVDQKGHFAAVKHTGPQHGQEVIWTGGWLYPRQRHGKFLRRRARAGEPRKTANRLAGYLPAYMELLAPHLTLKAGGETTHEQRKALRVALAPAPKPKAPLSASAATSPLSRRWRQSIKVQSLEGMVLLDARTGVVLSVDLTAAWTFTPPPAGAVPSSGIPEKLDPASSGTMKLQLSQRVTHIGKVEPIPPPPADKILDPRRVRLEKERQMFSGEIPIPEQGHRRVP